MRYAVVRRSSACPDRGALRRALPPTYDVVRDLDDGYIFGGADSGFQCFDCVLLELAGVGMRGVRELTRDEVGEWVPPADHPNDDSSTSAAAPTLEA